MTGAIGLDMDGYFALGPDGRAAADGWLDETGLGLPTNYVVQVEVLDESGTRVRVVRVAMAAGQPVIDGDEVVWEAFDAAVTVPFPTQVMRAITRFDDAEGARA